MKNTAVANLYNPHEQSKAQLIGSFVVRHEIFHELYQEISSAEMTQPNRHYLLEGQRGMGKTTLLLRLSYEIENDPDLQRWLIPIVLKEEAYYGIQRLFELWEAIIGELERKDEAFTNLSDDMDSAPDDQTDYEQRYREIVLAALERHSKKLLLFIDNLGELLRNFSDEENQRLHSLLTSSSALRIIGASPVILEAFFTPEHVFYQFFQKKRLDGLKKEETYELLLELAKVYKKKPAMQRVIDHQPGRVESLRILTGGVIRTIILLFEAFTEQEEGTTLADLDSVLDLVTPLYKSRMDDLTPSQRTVINTLALNWDALGQEELACKTRLKIDAMTTVLNELENIFMIERIGSDRQHPFYRLKERFFNIWYLMRLSSGGNQTKVVWLLHFLESWYGKTELSQHAQHHIRNVSQGRYQPRAAYYLTEAFVQSGQLDQEREHQLILTTKKLLQETDISLAKELSPSDKEIFHEGEAYYQNEQYEQAVTCFLRVKHKNAPLFFRLGYAFGKLTHYQEATTYFLQAAEQGHVEAMLHLGVLYHQYLHDKQQAETYYRMAAEKGRIEAMLNLGSLYYYTLQDYHKAERYYLMAVKEGQVRSRVLSSGNFSLKGLKNYLLTAIKGEIDAPEIYQFQDLPGAKTAYVQVVKETTAEALFQLSNLYMKELKDVQKAERYYRMAVDSGHTEAAVQLGDFCNYTLRNYQKAEKYYLMAAEKGNVDALVNLGLLYHGELKNPQKAEKYYVMAAEEGDIRAMNGLAWLYFEGKREKQRSLYYIRQTLKKDRNIYTAHTAACIYVWNDRPQEAFELAEEFMYAEEAYKTIGQDILFYLILLLAKQHYQQVRTYFESPRVNLSERFKPVYYALLYLMNDPDYDKLPPELSEPVTDIIRQVTQLAKDYQ